MGNFLKLKFRVESLMIVSLPIFMIISRFFLEFFLLIISFSFMVRIIKKNNYTIFKEYFSLFFLSLYVLLLLSFLFSDEKMNIISILLYFRFALYVFAILYFLKNEEHLLNYFLNTLLVLFFILFFDSLIQYTYGYNLIGLKIFETHRVTSFFGDEPILGSYIVKLFPFLLIFKEIINKNFKKTNYLITLAIFFSPIIIFLSGERSSVVLFFLMICYYLFFFIKTKKFKFIYFYVVFIILSTGTFLYNSDVYYDRYITQTMNSMFDKEARGNKFFLPKQYQDKNNFYLLSAQHQNFIYTGLNIFKENKLLGSGPKSFRYVCDNDNYKINEMSCNTHVHNYYLQALIETGLVGFVFIILTYLYIIYRSLKNFIKMLKGKFFSITEVIILGFYFTQLWPLMQTGSIFNNWNSIVLFLPIAFFLFFKEKKMKSINLVKPSIKKNILCF